MNGTASHDMQISLDSLDRRILTELQQDATLTADQLSDRVGLSRNACWRRVKMLEEAGVIRKRVALLDPVRVGCPLTAIVTIRTNRHEADWMARFQAILRTMPEVTGAYRMTGDLDYQLVVRVADMAGYDAFYKRLIDRIAVSDISASFVMEEIKHSTALPV